MICIRPVLRPSLQAHGSEVELLSLVDGVVRVRLQESNHAMASSTMMFKLAIEAALYETAPDMVRLEVENMTDAPAAASFIPLTQFRGVDHHAPQSMASTPWTSIGSRQQEGDAS